MWPSQQTFFLRARQAPPTSLKLANAPPRAVPVQREYDHGSTRSLTNGIYALPPLRRLMSQSFLANGGWVTRASTKPSRTGLGGAAGHVGPDHPPRGHLPGLLQAIPRYR